MKILTQAILRDGGTAAVMSALSLKDRRGQTPLELALKADQEEMVEVLFEWAKAAKIDLELITRGSYLHLAVELGNIHLVRTIINTFPLTITTRDEEGRSVMYYAQALGNDDSEDAHELYYEDVQALDSEDLKDAEEREAIQSFLMDQLIRMDDLRLVKELLYGERLSFQARVDC
jgi:hypothetical protein